MKKTALILALTLLVTRPVWADTPPFFVQETEIQDQKAVIATIQSVRDSQARARIQGTLSVLSVREGDYVKAGDKIAIIGDVKLSLQSQGLRAKIQAAEAALVKAKQDYARAEKLKKEGFATTARLDESKAALDIADNAFKAAQAEQQVVLQQSAEGAVLAPSSGRVLKVPVTAGSVVMPGETIAVLSQENYILRIDVPERHARFMKVGDPVVIGAHGMQEVRSGDMKTGVIQMIYPEIKDGRVQADVRADNLGDFFVGERARVYIQANKRKTILIPTQAVVRKAGIDFVSLHDGSSVVVQIGQIYEDKTEILSGLRAGDEVVMP